MLPIMKFPHVLILCVLCLAFQRDGNLLFQDDFSTRAQRWSLSETPKAEIDYIDEQLAVTIVSPGFGMLSLPDFDLKLRDYHLTFTAQILDGEGIVGVIFNYQDDAYYRLDIADEEIAWILVEDEDETIIQTDEFDMTEILKVDLIAQDGVFTLRINEQEMPTLEDDTLEVGIFGVYARAGKGALRVAFDDVQVVDVQ